MDMDMLIKIMIIILTVTLVVNTIFNIINARKPKKIEYDNLDKPNAPKKSSKKGE